jgi:hypothetical protein
MVAGLATLGSSKTMQEARDEIAILFEKLVRDYDIGVYSSHPASEIGYFRAEAMAALVVVHGNTSCLPL